MRVVIQRVLQSAVTADEKIIAEIKNGLLVLRGITHEDAPEDADWLCKKIADLRIFNDANGVMNISVKENKGEVIVVSQFTLHASTKKGNRPSYINAAKPDEAIPLYEYFVLSLQKELNTKIQTGKFGADMKVALVNDGPVTIIMDSKRKE